MLRSIINRPTSLLLLEVLGIGILLAVIVAARSPDIDLQVTGSTHRPLILTGQGQVKQMPAGDYLDPTTLVDTTGCSSTNVIAWNGSQFACAAGGGGGGGITNGAGNNVVMKSNGTNAVASGLSDDGTTISTSEKLSVTGNVTSTMNFVADSPATAKFGILAGGVPGGYTYITDSELDYGYETNGAFTGFINYSGYHGSTTQRRSLWVGDGTQGATSVLFVNGSNDRVGINNNSPTLALDVVGAAIISGIANLNGGVSSTSGVLHWGPFGGNGGFNVDPAGNDSYFQPFATSYGFGFNVTNSIESPVDIQDLTFAPGTSNPRTDNNPLMIRGLSTAHFDTTSAALDPWGVFFDMSPVKSAGSNRLSSVTMRLDNRGPDHATALWVDEGESSFGTHIMFTVRPSSPITAPPSLTCGTGATVAGNDNGGRISVGTGTVTSCQLSFQTAWIDHTSTNITPSCMMQSESGIALTISAVSASSVTFAGSALQSTFIDYRCSGADNNVPVIGP